MARKTKLSFKALLLMSVVAPLLLISGGGVVYDAVGSDKCAGCHEIRPAYEMWTNSSHRELDCKECHGSVLTLDAGFHLSNLRRVVKHWQGEVGPQVILARWQDVERVSAECERCHRQQYAAWRAGPHSATYADIFLDQEHNSTRALMDDCFRCHGMHYQGSIGDLVAPLSTDGPWKLVQSELADRPTMPCLACHEIHSHGEPKPARDRLAPTAAMDEEQMTASLALFDRRTQMHIQTAGMPVPRLLNNGTPVKMNEDPRQALCYQCHAPRAEMQTGSGDDRTGIGVHEGVGCLACHHHHTGETRASCANCHPRDSNCGMTIPRMLELVSHPDSQFDVHTVTCADCHPKGVPERKTDLRD